MNKKERFMEALMKMGFQVGEYGWMSPSAYANGAFDISAEHDPKTGYIQQYFDYYEEYMNQTISDEMEEMAARYGYWFEWYNPGVVVAIPDEY